MSTFAGDQLNKHRRTVTLILDLLTGYCRLSKYTSKLDLTKNSICRFCKTEEEALQHSIYQCRELAKLKLECIADSIEKLLADTD